MNSLATLLSSQARAEVFRLLFDGEKQSIYLRDLQRRSGLSIGSIQKEIALLKSLDLVVATKDGNRLYYSANSNHPLYREICSLVEKTSGIPERLKELLNNLTGIDCAFIFGSIASGTEKAHSDIDLMIIGDIGLRSVLPKLKKVTESTGREVNPHVYSSKSWKDKLKKKDHFITTVMRAEKILLIGDQDVLESMG